MSKTIKYRTCKFCGDDFKPKEASQKYCSSECWYNDLQNYCKQRDEEIENKTKRKMLKCVVCGREYEYQHNRSKCCSTTCSFKRFKQTNNKWYENNKEKMLKYRKQYYKSNRKQTDKLAVKENNIFKLKENI